MDIHSRIKLTADEIRSYGAVAILGAGISLGQGFPLTQNLRMLLWKALDSDESARKELAAKLGQKLSPTKILIGDDPYKTDLALNILVSSQVARKTFQYSFKKLNDEQITKPSISHDIISELLHRRIIKMVMSLNWDTLLETAYHRRYGGTIHPGDDWLKKPHGDAANPDIKWILPNEASYLPDDIIQEISELAKDYPRILLIIGYSEKDEEIVSKIIKPLSDQWVVIRIGPQTTDEYSIPLTAEDALIKLSKSIITTPEEVLGCDYVKFDNQHNLNPALIGIGLGPEDANACPRLPEVDIAKQQLEVAGSSVIIGEIGSGKSLIAYQIAYDLNKDGWEVLRFFNIMQTKELLMAQILNLPRKSLLIIDNAQALDKDVISYILENASSDKLRVLIISTDESVSIRYNKIHVASKRAVSIIAKAFKNRQKEILPIIQKLDEDIGEGFFQMPLEYRIINAEKSSKTPWQFNFILTGGWHRAGTELTMLREMERFDLLLTAISVKQIVSLDTGSSIEWLEKASKTLGKDRHWMIRSLQALKDRRLIIEGDTIRCPHVRFSEIIIGIVYSNREEKYHEQLIDLFRIALYEEIPSLKGIYWAFNSWIQSENSCYLFESIIDSQILISILNRCWAASSNEDINYASLVLSILVSRYLKRFDDFALNSKLIAKWIEEADAKSVYGLGMLLNDLGQKDHKLTENIISLADPQIIANNLSQISISDAYVWGHLLGRLVYAAPREWLVRLKDSLDHSALHSLFSNVKVETNDIDSLNELAQGIYCLDDSLGIKLVDSSIPTIISAINKDIIKFQDIFRIVSFVLGFAPNFLRQREPSKDQKQIAYRLADGIDPVSMAQFISQSRRRDWQSYADLIKFLNEVMPEKVPKIAHLVDFNALDDTSKGLWGNPPHELLSMMAALAIGDNFEPARSWINKHSNEIVSLHPLLVAISPESTTTILKQGYNLDFKLGDLAHWNLAAITVRSLSTVDKDLASMVLRTNQVGISQGLVLKRHDCDYKGFPEFINLMNDLAPDTLKKCLESLDPITVKASWSERLKGKSITVNGKVEERQAAEALINLVIDQNITSLVDVSQELKKLLNITQLNSK